MLPDERWIITQHVCRRCLGSVLQLSGTETQRNGTFLCSICHARSQGTVETICGCGLTTRDAGRAGKRMPFQCRPNPAPGPGNPAAFVIGFAAEETTA